MMHSKLLMLAAAAGLAAGSFDAGVWVNKQGHCAGSYKDSDGYDVPQCMGSEYTLDGDASVCSKVGYKCQIEGCGAAVPGLPTCAVMETKTKKKSGSGSGSSGSGQQINPKPSAASGGMRDTVITNPMRGWMDMKDSQFNRFPPTVVGRKALVPTVRTEAGFQMILECVDGYGGKGGYCDHFVFLYSCPPCAFDDGGNLAAALLAEGWMPFRCSAYFDLDINYASAEHPFVIYHKQTMQGTDDVIVPAEMLDFVFYANTPATSYCPAHVTEVDCNANIPAECIWKDGSCQAHLCPKPSPQGPWPPKQRCTVCPFDPSEARFIPPLP